MRENTMNIEPPGESPGCTRRSRHGRYALALAGPLLAGLSRAPMADDFKLPPISLGAGLRTSFTRTDNEAPATDTSKFALDSARIYINGTVLPSLKVMF